MTATGMVPVTLILAALALVAVAAILLEPGPVGFVVSAIGLTLALLAAGLRLRAGRGQRRRLKQARQLAWLHQDAPQPVVVTDRQGIPVAANPAAGAQAPADFVARHCAEPDRLVFALRQEALAKGHAERLLKRKGRTLRLSALRAGAPGGPEGVLLVWQRLDLDAVSSRTIAALGVPVLTLGPGGAPMAANPALRRLCAEQEGETDDATTPDGAPAELPGIRALAAQCGAAEDAAPGIMAPARPVSLNGRPLLARLVMAEDGQVDVVLSPPTAGTGAPQPGSVTPFTSDSDTAPDNLSEPGRTSVPASGDVPAADTAQPAPDVAAFADFENLPVALMLIEPDGAVRRSNRLARALMGIAPGPAPYLSELVEALGRPVADWLADAHAGRALNRPEVMRAINPGQETFVQIILRRPPSAGRLLYAVVSDATEMKTLEARFVQSQKMQAIGQLAGGVAHDFNNLLTAISGHCDLLLLNRDYYDPEYDDLMQIHQNANRAAALVRQLLAFSRRQTMKPEQLPLENLLEDLAQLLARLVGERIALRLSHDRRLGPIWADRRQLEQVIMNLVVNARDAMPMGGEIRIRTRALYLDQDMERGRARIPAGEYALIEVEDEGIGIPDDNLDKIFEPFFTTKKPGEGTGLGLSTAYGIVKQLGGYIFADSTEGTGTVFSLYFATYGRGVFPEVDTNVAPGSRLTVLPDQRDRLTSQPDAPVQAGRSVPSRGLSDHHAPGGGGPGGTLAHENSPLPGLEGPGAGLCADEPATKTLQPALSPKGPNGPTATVPEGSGTPRGVGSVRRRHSTAPAAAVWREPGGTGSPDGAGEHGEPRAAAGIGSGSGSGVAADVSSDRPRRTAARPAPPAVAVPQAAGNDTTVLLVEDEAPVRAFAARALRLQGYRVIEAENGEQALHFLQEPALTVDIFVSDVVMPGLDGPGWVARALLDRPHVPVVFTSGYAEDSLSAALSRIPGAVFLDKPFSLTALNRLIEEQMSRARGGGGP